MTETVRPAAPQADMTPEAFAKMLHKKIREATGGQPRERIKVETYDQRKRWFEEHYPERPWGEENNVFDREVVEATLTRFVDDQQFQAHIRISMVQVNRVAFGPEEFARITGEEMAFAVERRIETYLKEKNHVPA